MPEGPARPRRRAIVAIGVGAVTIDAALLGLIAPLLPTSKRAPAPAMPHWGSPSPPARRTLMINRRLDLFPDWQRLPLNTVATAVPQRRRRPAVA